MHLQQTIITPGFDHARRAVDVNRPVTFLVRSCCDAGRAGTHRYRGIGIHCTPCQVGRSPKDDFRFS